GGGFDLRRLGIRIQDDLPLRLRQRAANQQETGSDIPCTPRNTRQHHGLAQLPPTSAGYKRLHGSNRLATGKVVAAEWLNLPLGHGAAARLERPSITYSQGSDSSIYRLYRPICRNCDAINYGAQFPLVSRRHGGARGRGLTKNRGQFAAL